MTATPLQDACEAVDEMTEAQAAENRERYAFDRMLAATDRLLWELEELNLGDIMVLPVETARRMRRSLRHLPAVCRVRFVVDDRVQVVLDSVFDVQEALFRWRDPRYGAEETEPETELRPRIRMWLLRQPLQSMTELRSHFSGYTPYEVLSATVNDMLRAGELGYRMDGMGRKTPRYFAVEEAA